MKENRESAATRMCSAADAILEAFWQFSSRSVRVYPYPPDLLALPDCPECLHGFKTDELADATDFLLRLGFLKRV